MQFFQEQEHARLETRKLIILYFLAVIGVLFSINVLILYLFSYIHNIHFLDASVNTSFSFNTFVIVTGVSLFTMICGYFHFTSKLSQGGISVARLVGAVEVNKNTRDLYERRFLNVLAEVSLAANMPAPHAYVMSDSSINAFAAGLTTRDSVIAVTEGALTRLTRDELQGVLAHEIGHLINGDSRLNIRLIGLLGSFMGIALVGSWLAENSFSTTRVSRSNNVAGLVILLGIGLWILGYVGIIIGKMLKSAISIEREFYADARSVQYTRNPDGLGGALRKIAGYTSSVSHPNKEIISHMFLDGDSSAFVDGWFPTHPPVIDRIKAIYGKRMPELGAIVLTEEQLLNEQGSQMLQGFTGKPVKSAPLTKDTRPDITYLPKGLNLDYLLSDSEWIMAIVISLISVNNVNVKDELVFSNTTSIWSKINAVKPELLKLSLHEQLMLINSISPSLYKLDKHIQNQLALSINQIIYADKHCDFKEFLFYTLFSFSLGHTAPVKLDKVLDNSISPLVSKFAEMPNDGSAEEHYNSAMSQLGMSNRMSYKKTVDFNGLFDLVKSLRELKPLEKDRLLQALRASVSTIQGLDENSAALLNVLAAVLDVPWAIFKSNKF